MNERAKYDSRSKKYGHHTVAVSLTSIDPGIHQRKDLNISDSGVNRAWPPVLSSPNGHSRQASLN